MTPKQRVLMALNHKEPDRVPVDLGSTNVTSINVDSYKKLCSYLGVTLSEEIKIVERAQQIVTPEETVLQSLCIDTRSVWLKRPKNWEISLREDNSYIDEWGITRRKSYDGLYFDPVVFPLKESEIEDLRTYSWPDPGDSERFKGLKEKTKPIDLFAATLIENYELTCVILNGTKSSSRILNYFKSTKLEDKIYTKII